MSGCPSSPRDLTERCYRTQDRAGSLKPSLHPQAPPRSPHPIAWIPALNCVDPRIPPLSAPCDDQVAEGGSTVRGPEMRRRRS
jgi:hypothetical protein